MSLNIDDLQTEIRTLDVRNKNQQCQHLDRNVVQCEQWATVTVRSLLLPNYDS